MITIPLSNIPSQRFTATVNGQPCVFWIRQLATGLYLDLWLNTAPIALGVLCQNGTKVILDPTVPLKGDFIWHDMLGNDDPNYTELGTRFVLEYLDE